MYLMIICLGSMLPSTSSDLPDSRSGRSMAVHLSEFGLASDGVCRARHVTMPAVVSYTAFPPLPGRQAAPAVYFCCTFLGVTSTGRYPASCPVKPGLSSPAFLQPRSSVRLILISNHILYREEGTSYKFPAK